MAVATVPVTSESRPVRAVTARHTIGVEPHTDYRCPTVRMAVVERYGGLLIGVRCRDVDLLDGASLEDAARSYAVMFEADYVGRRRRPGCTSRRTRSRVRRSSSSPRAGVPGRELVGLDRREVSGWTASVARCVWSTRYTSASPGLPADRPRWSTSRTRHGFGRLVHVTELGEVTC
jgi:hypothetical protein